MHRLGDDAFLAQPHRKQRLADGIVDLVRTREGELLALEIDLRSTAPLCEPLGVVEWCGTADVLRSHELNLLHELGIGLGGAICLLELMVRLHQSLRHIAPAKLSEIARKFS